MATVMSAALAVVHEGETGPEVLVGHMGGPLWVRKVRSWSVPKGLYDDEEDPAVAARRELAEETGYLWPGDWPLVELGDFRVSGSKIVRAFLVLEPAGATPPWTAADFTSNTFDLEWPPRSGRIQAYPEIDRAEFCTLERAREIVVAGQVPVIEAIQARLADPGLT